MYQRFVLIAFLFITSHCALGQMPVAVEPTSATDPGVRIHSPRKIFSVNHNKNLRRYKSHSHITEREGQTMPKQRHKNKYAARETNVYKRQSPLFARKGKSTKSKLKIYRKYSMAKN